MPVVGLYCGCSQRSIHFPSLPPRQKVRPRGRGRSYHIEARDMAEIFNTPTVQFLIEASLPGSATVVDRFTIEQNEGPRRDTKRERAMYNTVQAHLHDLSVKTTLDYKIVRWGDVKDRTEWLQGGPLGE